jgi:putative methionine-R-sulfoxide reductase with GAF domain
VSDQKNKSALDQQTPGKLPEAESGLLSHTPGSKPVSDYALTLAEIVEAQHQIQLRHLALDEAMALVAERIARITHASGAAVGMVEGNHIRYRASVGASALPLGNEVPLDAAICAACVRRGQVLRMPDVNQPDVNQPDANQPDVNQESLFDPEPCRKRGIQALVAAPIYHDGNVVGALEVYFDRSHGFAEQDVHTCQLMAGLVTEAIGRDAGSALRKSMAAERSSMLAAIEKIKPNLAALAGERAKDRASESGAKSSALPASVSDGEGCWKCGSALIEGEQFCGNCGAPRIGESDRSTQSKIASALHRHQASRELPFAPLNENPGELAPHNSAALDSAGKTKSEAIEIDEPKREDEEDEKDLLQQFALPMLDDPVPEEPVAKTPVLKEENEDAALPAQLSAGSVAEESTEPASAGLQRTRNSFENGSATLMAPQEPGIHWSSAAKARNFLEGLSRSTTHDAFGSFWHSRRGDFYLAVAIILVLVAIRWGLFADRSAGAGSAASANSLRHKSPADDLSLFDKLLIDLGLAEAPDTPEYKYMGNPNTQVWIDTHTALYYCPGSELYGKTANGRFASQHDAQLDQFESASRRACD